MHWVRNAGAPIFYYIMQFVTPIRTFCSAGGFRRQSKLMMVMAPETPYLLAGPAIIVAGCSALACMVCVAAHPKFFEKRAFDPGDAAINTVPGYMLWSGGQHHR